MVGHDDISEMQVPDAFESLYRREYDTMVALAYSMTASRAAAEEVAQDAFLRALKEWDRVSAMESPGGWLRVVTLNLARSRWRRLKTELTAILRLHPDESTGLDVSQIEAQEFWALVRRLPARQAQVLALRYVEDRTLAEIATLLGIAEGTVKALMHQARQKLRPQLEAKGWAVDEI